jgi:hypothetical protein
VPINHILLGARQVVMKVYSGTTVDLLFADPILQDAAFVLWSWLSVSLVT